MRMPEWEAMNEDAWMRGHDKLKDNEWERIDKVKKINVSEWMKRRKYEVDGINEWEGLHE